MTQQLSFDAERYCRNNQGRLHLPDGSDPMALIAEELRKAKELREAVAWERECIDTWEYGTALKMQALDEQVASMSAARAEVDRLLGEKPL